MTSAQMEGGSAGLWGNGAPRWRGRISVEGGREPDEASDRKRDQAHLQVEVLGAEDADVDELNNLTQLLRDELLLLDVDAVDAAQKGSAPAGAKGIDLLAIGGLIVRMARSARLLDAVVKTIGLWVERVGTRRVRIELDGDVLEVTGLSSSEQRMLIEAWIARHAPRQAER